ncbi:MAG: DUF3575 domain-containing protein [Bacteroidota bacterium]
MKKALFILLLLPLLSIAQTGNKKNILKINLSSLVVKNFHFIYERSITRHVSVSIAYRYMPKGEVPLENFLEKIIDDPDVDIQAFQMGNSAVTPEVRFYLGRGTMRGFYLAPYARFASFDVTVPVKYNSSTVLGTKKEALFSGKVHSTSGGLMMGVQRQIFKTLVFDLWIIGGHYGTCNGTLNATDINPPMTTLERADLDQSLSDIDAKPFNVSGHTTSSTTAIATVSGPWAGVRMAGLTVGLRF